MTPHIHPHQAYRRTVCGQSQTPVRHLSVRPHIKAAQAHFHAQRVALCPYPLAAVISQRPLSLALAQVSENTPIRHDTLTHSLQSPLRNVSHTASWVAQDRAPSHTISVHGVTHPQLRAHATITTIRAFKAIVCGARESLVITQSLHNREGQVVKLFTARTIHQDSGHIRQHARRGGR